MLSIKVLGPGCTNCLKVAQLAQQAADALKVEASIEKVTEFPEMMKYKILATPGLVINEKVLCAGRIPSLAEVTTWIANTVA